MEKAQKEVENVRNITNVIFMPEEERIKLIGKRRAGPCSADLTEVEFRENKPSPVYDVRVVCPALVFRIENITEKGTAFDVLDNIHVRSLVY